MCGLLNLLLCGIVNTKRDVVPEGVVKEDGLLIDVTDELAQIVNA